jgi:hypothetical protein
VALATTDKGDDEQMRLFKKIISSRSVYIAVTIGTAVHASGAAHKWH